MRVIKKGIEGRVKRVQRDYGTVENLGGVRYRSGQLDRRERETRVYASVYSIKYAKSVSLLKELWSCLYRACYQESNKVWARW